MHKRDVCQWTNTAFNVNYDSHSLCGNKVYTYTKKKEDIIDAIQQQSIIAFLLKDISWPYFIVRGCIRIYCFFLLLLSVKKNDEWILL